MQKKNYNPITKARDIVEASAEATEEAFKKARVPSPLKKKPTGPENISRHEGGLRRLEEEARQNQLRRRKMKRG